MWCWRRRKARRCRSAAPRPKRSLRSPRLARKSERPHQDEIAATPPEEQPEIVEAADAAPAAAFRCRQGSGLYRVRGAGNASAADVAQQLRGLSETDKPRLARLGLRFGVETVYLPDLLKPAQIELRALL